MGGNGNNRGMAGMAGILGMLGGAHHSPPSSPSSYDAIVTTVKDSQNGITTTTTVTEQYYPNQNNSKNEQLHQQQHHPNVPSKNDRNKISGNNTLEILRAVAPEGRLGLAVREIGEWDVDRKGLETGSGRIHDLYTLRLGVLEVTVGNLTEIFDETDAYGNSNHGTERQKAAAERIKKDAKGRRIEIPPTNNTNTTGNNTTTLTNAGDTSLTPPQNTPWSNFLASMTKGLERTGKGLQLNANMLWNEVTDAEFGHRFVDAGGKVAGNFGTTLERTVGVAGDVWRMWRDGRSDGSGDGDGDGND